MPSQLQDMCSQTLGIRLWNNSRDYTTIPRSPLSEQSEHIVYEFHEHNTPKKITKMSSSNNQVQIQFLYKKFFMWNAAVQNLPNKANTIWVVTRFFVEDAWKEEGVCSKSITRDPCQLRRRWICLARMTQYLTSGLKVYFWNGWPPQAMSGGKGEALSKRLAYED